MLLLYRDIQNNFIEVELPTEGGIVGYGADNFIVLDAIGISGKHMRLSSKGEHLFIEDLQSLNGTYINQKLLSEKTQLSDGDVVQIGLLQLRFNIGFNLWSMTAEKPENSIFSADEYDITEFQEAEEEFSTAVTVIASPEIKAALKSSNVSALQNFAPPQNTNVTVGSKFSLENLKELGKYKIIKKIGKGGMGIVFLARHKVLNSYRALKVLPRSVKEENYNFYERFMREAHISSDIRHPNIVGVIDAETDPEQDVSYIVMEFIDGGNLRRILKTKKNLSEIQALLIVRNIAAALKGIAEHNIVHRDIKPDNIMFTRQGDVKLADLGIAKNDNDNANITRSDAMIGTPAYLSPEQIENPKEVDIRSDIYSLGATLYEMLTGSPPYTGKNTYDIVHRMLSESIPDPRLKNPSVSSIAAKIVMKMLSKTPGARYQTPQALLDVLNRVLPEYVEKDVQKIIQSAILNTELPKGVKPSLAVGFKAFASFMLFSFRINAAAIFYKLSGNSRNSENDAEYMENLISLNADPQKIPVYKVSFIIKTVPDTEFVITSSNKESVQITSDHDGTLRINNLPGDEYSIRLKDGSA